MTHLSQKSLLMVSAAALCTMTGGAMAQDRGACGQLVALTHSQYLITGATAPAIDTVVSIARREPAYIELEIGQSTGLTIETSSGTADPVLVMFDASGNPLLGNDDGAGGLNSLLSLELEPGRYCAQVSTYTSIPDGTGTPTGFNENIPLQIRTGLETPAVDSGAGGQPAANCFAMSNLTRLEDPIGAGMEAVSLNGSVPYAYTFSVEDGTNMSLVARSTTLDTLLTLVDINGNEIASDDDGAGGTDSHIGIDYGLPAGDYCVAVTGYDNTATGPADLTISEYSENVGSGSGGGSNAPANPCGDPSNTTTVSAGETIQGFLDGASSDFRFDLSEPMAMRLTATSNNMDTYLWLYTAEGSLLGENDDADGLGTGSRIEYSDQLPVGSYCAVVTPFGGEGSGNFDLQLMELSEEALLKEAYENAELMPPASSGVEMIDLGLLQRNLRTDNAGGETQWYLFEVEEESFVVIDSASVGAVSEIALFDYEGSGQRIASSQVNGESISARLVKKIGSGIYALAVVPDRSASAGVGASALSLQRYIRPPRQ